MPSEQTLQTLQAFVEDVGSKFTYCEFSQLTDKGNRWAFSAEKANSSGIEVLIKQFDQLKPLLEGSVFAMTLKVDKAITKTNIALELMPGILDNLQLSFFDMASQKMQRQVLKVQNISKLYLPRPTFEQVQKYKKAVKDAKDTSGFEFDFVIQFKRPMVVSLVGASLEQELSKLRLCTSNYSDLKKWTIGVNELI